MPVIGRAVYLTMKDIKRVLQRKLNYLRESPSFRAPTMENSD